MVGTSIDDFILGQAGASADQLMAKAKSLGMNTVRVGAYWNEIQPNGPGDHDFSRLDALLAAAKKYGLKIILSVGAKAPSWPEYHLPAWVHPHARGSDISRDPVFRRNAESFVKRVADHVAGNSTIVMWQVENEPFNPGGPTRWTMDPSMVAAEARILREADGHRRPVLVNCFSAGGSQQTAAINAAFRIGDVVGLDVYAHTPTTDGSKVRTDLIPRWVHERARETGKPAMITELQADDWGGYRARAPDVRSLAHHVEHLGYRDVLFWRLGTNIERDRRHDTSLDRIEKRLTWELLHGHRR